MNIVFPHNIGFDKATHKKFYDLGVRMYEDTPTDEAVLIERISDAELIAANFVDVTSKVIDAVPTLKFIIAPGAGYERVDTEYATSKGIKVLNCPTQNAQAVAEHAVMLMGAVAHRIVEASLDLRQGGWHKQELTGFELTGKQLAIVGYGRIGKLIEKKVSGFEMDVSHVNTNSTEEEVDMLLQKSDIVCLCLSLNNTSLNILDERRLNSLKREAILINVARGNHVDQDVLYDLLRKGAILGAGLDAFKDEPQIGNVAPDTIRRLARLPNVVATPHRSYNTRETAERLGEELWEGIISCMKDKPINVVN